MNSNIVTSMKTYQMALSIFSGGAVFTLTAMGFIIYNRATGNIPSEENSASPHKAFINRNAASVYGQCRKQIMTEGYSSYSPQNMQNVC